MCATRCFLLINSLRGTQYLTPSESRSSRLLCTPCRKMDPRAPSVAPSPAPCRRLIGLELLIEISLAVHAGLSCSHVSQHILPEEASGPRRNPAPELADAFRYCPDSTRPAWATCSHGRPQSQRHDARRPRPVQSAPQSPPPAAASAATPRSPAAQMRRVVAREQRVRVHHAVHAARFR